MMDYELQVVTPNEDEPISTADAKLHLRVDDSTDDDLIDGLITTAREWVEENCNAALMTQTLLVQLDNWPEDGEFRLPRYPLQSIAEISYKDKDGTQYTMDLSDLIVDTVAKPGRIVLKADADWPSETLQIKAGIQIQYVAGFGDEATNVPKQVIHAMKLIIAHLYENRELAVVGSGLTVNQLPFTVSSLLANLKY